MKVYVGCTNTDEANNIHVHVQYIQTYCTVSTPNCLVNAHLLALNAPEHRQAWLVASHIFSQGWRGSGGLAF